MHRKSVVHETVRQRFIIRQHPPFCVPRSVGFCHSFRHDAVITLSHNLRESESHPISCVAFNLDNLGVDQSLHLFQLQFARRMAVQTEAAGLDCRPFTAIWHAHIECVLFGA